MNIRQYREGDAPAMAKIFYETVHSINARDYTEKQLNAWADNRKTLFSAYRLVGGKTEYRDKKRRHIDQLSYGKTACLNFFTNSRLHFYFLCDIIFQNKTFQF